MATLVYDEYVEKQIRDQREKCDAYKWDEVWDGIYVVLPPRDLQHQDIVAGLATMLYQLFGLNGPNTACMQCAVSDRTDDWESNYRIPDLSVVLQDSRAKDCESHYCGGPDFLVEVVCPHDRSREKMEFYAKIGVRELLMVDRDPWSLELYRLELGKLGLVGRSSLDRSDDMASDVIPLSFGVVPGTARSQIEIRHRDGRQRWSV